MRASFAPRRHPEAPLTLALALVFGASNVGFRSSIAQADPALAAPAPAGAPGQQDTEACFEAAEAAQPLMRQNRLRAARLELDICVRESCPRVVRSDCGAWLSSVDANTPTVRLSATETRGGRRSPVEAARVLVDGDVLVAAHLDDQPRAVDPGTHVFRFERPGASGGNPNATTEVRVTVPAGAKGQRIEASFVASSEAPVAVEASSRAGNNQDWLGYLLGSTGVVALGAGIYFEASGLSARGHLDDTCKADRSCLQSDVDSARNRVLAGDLLVGAGIVLLGTGAVVLLTGSSAPAHRKADQAAFRFDVRPIVGGAAASVSGSL